MKPLYTMPIKATAICIAIIFVFSMCNRLKQDEQTKEINELLPSDVTVLYTYKFENAAFPEWTKGFNSQQYLDELYAGVASSKITAHKDILYSLKQVASISDFVVLPPDSIFRFDSTTNIAFAEQWSMNTQSFQFNKDVCGIAPVREYYDPRFGQKALQILFWVSPNEKNRKKTGTILAKDITYEVKTGEIQQRNFNMEFLVDLLLKKIIYDSVPAYDFFNNKQLTVSDIKKRFGFGFEVEKTIDEDGNIITKDTGNQISDEEFLRSIYYDEIRSIVFNEDWYMGSDHSIQKKVKSIALVREFYSDLDTLQEDLRRVAVFKVNLK